VHSIIETSVFIRDAARAGVSDDERAREYPTTSAPISSI